MSREKFSNYPGKPGRPVTIRKCPWCSRGFTNLNAINSHVSRCMAQSRARAVPLAEPGSDKWLKS